MLRLPRIQRLLGQLISSAKLVYTDDPMHGCVGMKSLNFVKFAKFVFVPPILRGVCLSSDAKPLLGP